MTWMDRKRLDASTFEIDPRMRRGRYTDQYFNNAAQILSALAQEGYRFAGEQPASDESSAQAEVDVGNIAVEMQYFTKREPFAIACGLDHAIAILKECTGFFDEAGTFHNTCDRLQIEAVGDGAKLAPWVPAMKVRGRYRDFAILETPTLGVLARQTRIATNTYEALTAAAGKGVLMFGARFDLPETQAADGYAYKVGVDRYNADAGRNVPAAITTEAQGAWWGAEGAGTTSHSYILCFLRGTTEAMLQFARCVPPDVKRIALVDTNNDCVGDSRRCAMALFGRWRALRAAGRREEAEKYVLFGVRCDTAGEQRDVNVEPTGDPREDCGVTPRLVRKVRQALDDLAVTAGISPEDAESADRYFRDIKIVASGGFHPRRIERFEREKAPVDFYGIGSYLMNGPATDFTADVVRVKVEGKWRDMAKVGRKAVPNPELETV